MVRYRGICRRDFPAGAARFGTTWSWPGTFITYRSDRICQELCIKYANSTNRTDFVILDAMIVIRLTDKLSRHMKARPAEHVPLAANPLLDWCACLFAVDSVPCVLATNTTTLYSTIFSGAGITREAIFVERMLASLCELLDNAGFAGVYNRQIKPFADSVVFGRNSNRSVTGSMNDLVKMSSYLRERPSAFVKMSQAINTSPMSYLKHHSPDRAFRALLADYHPPRHSMADFDTI